MSGRANFPVLPNVCNVVEKGFSVALQHEIVVEKGFSVTLQHEIGVEKGFSVASQHEIGVEKGFSVALQHEIGVEKGFSGTSQHEIGVEKGFSVALQHGNGVEKGFSGTSQHGKDKKMTYDMAPTRNGLPEGFPSIKFAAKSMIARRHDCYFTKLIQGKRNHFHDAKQKKFYQKAVFWQNSCYPAFAGTKTQTHPLCNSIFLRRPQANKSIPCLERDKNYPP